MSEQDNCKEETHAQLCVRLVRELQGTVCFCGSKKRSEQTFCYKHYRDLPRAKQYALYNRIGEGYEEVYLDARQYLGSQSSAQAMRSLDLPNCLPPAFDLWIAQDLRSVAEPAEYFCGSHCIFVLPEEQSEVNTVDAVGFELCVAHRCSYLGR
jgi:hypothetical protein